MFLNRPTFYICHINYSYYEKHNTINFGIVETYKHPVMRAKVWISDKTLDSVCLSRLLHLGGVVPIKSIGHWHASYFPRNPVNLVYKKKI